MGELAADRTVLQIGGADARDFLQGLVTNDMRRMDHGLVYAAMLTPQGKFIADFFLSRGEDGRILLDVHDSLAEPLMQRLSMYKLRADVTIAETSLSVTRGLGDAPASALPDPRHPALGWRAYGAEATNAPGIDWDAIRVAHLIPETGAELTPDSYILEHRFEALSGVDFRKGCYVGQEVTARMKHKTDLRKGLTRVRLGGAAKAGDSIETADGKAAGVLTTVAGDGALAYLRFDRAAGALRAGDAVVTHDPD